MGTKVHIDLSQKIIEEVDESSSFSDELDIMESSSLEDYNLSMTCSVIDVD